MKTNKQNNNNTNTKRKKQVNKQTKTQNKQPKPTADKLTANNLQAKQTIRNTNHKTTK